MEQSRRNVQTLIIGKQQKTFFLGQKTPQKQTLLDRLSRRMTKNISNKNNPKSRTKLKAGKNEIKNLIHADPS